MGKNKNQKKRKRSLSSEEKDDKGQKGIEKQNPNQKKPSEVSKTSSAAVATTKYAGNPLLEQQTKFLQQDGLTETERKEFFSPEIPAERRAELWMAQADLGEELVNQYAWATPDATAIRILKEFSPLIEIGCGSNAYWCHILRQHGIDIVGYDVNVSSGGKIGKGTSDMKPANKKSKNDTTPSFLHKGGPEVLGTKEIQKSGRTLFLCYPDEEDDDANDKDPKGGDDDDDDEAEDDEDDGATMPTSMGWQCLHHYKGEYVIHVGETFLDANLSIEQAPWGRSSSPEFQQRLACQYHCLLKVELPNWFHTRDTITVWKRSMISTMVFAADDDEDKEEEEDDDDDDEDEEVEYRHIPINERLPTNIAAPCLAHLLPNNTNPATVLNDKKALPSPLAEKPTGTPTKSKPDASKSPKSSKKETPERPPAASNSTNPPTDTSKTNSNKKEQKKQGNKNDRQQQQVSGQGSTTPTTAKSPGKKDKNDALAEMDKVSDKPQRQGKKKYVTPW